MSFKRSDGRKVTEPRPMSGKVGIVPNADVSAMFQIGKTTAYAAVYGPRNVFPRFMQNPRRGILRCYYTMMPFSSAGDRIRPGQNRRAKEISMVTEKALLPVLNLEAFPNAGVDVFIELPQTDAGTRCAGICAAAMALADAGLLMKDMVTAVSVGLLGKEHVVVDLDYAEEAYEGGSVDIPIAVVPGSKEFTLLQLDGHITKDQLMKALKMGLDQMDQLTAVQREALKEKYKSLPADSE